MSLRNRINSARGGSRYEQFMVMVGSCSDRPRALAWMFHAYRRILSPLLRALYWTFRVFWCHAGSACSSALLHSRVWLLQCIMIVLSITWLCWITALYCRMACLNFGFGILESWRKTRAWPTVQDMFQSFARTCCRFSFGKTRIQDSNQDSGCMFH